MAELADALDSGSSGRKVVRVQIPSLAPKEQDKTDTVLRKTVCMRYDEGFEYIFKALFLVGFHEVK